MMMKSRLLILFLVFSISSVAQTDSKSQQILKGVSTKYKSLKSLKTTFTILIENEKDKSKEEQKGTLYLKGQKYKLEIAGQDILTDGKTRWTFVKDANEIQIDNQKTDENSITPTNIFTMYEKGWISSFKGEQKVNNINSQLIELVPVDTKSKNIFKVKLTINKAQKTISSAKIYDKNGSVQTITINKFTPDGASDESIYIFNASKYPGSDVVDLR
jgi:outer membrane lipoprotein-sorting protein